jgi:hypothetical protein
MKILFMLVMFGLCMSEDSSKVVISNTNIVNAQPTVIVYTVPPKKERHFNKAELIAVSVASLMAMVMFTAMASATD